VDPFPDITEGAGAFIDGGAPRFEDCLFERLRTRHDLVGPGGAVHIEADNGPARPVFLRTTFRENTASQGGAVYLSTSVGYFFFCRFEHNVALSGGALATFASAVTVIGSTFVGNRAEPGTSSGYGGAISMSNAPFGGQPSLIASTLFAGNAARIGGAMTPAGSGTLPLDLVGVTMAGNEASESAGAIRFLNAGGGRLHNVVLWGNQAPVGPEVYVAAGAGPAVERALIAGGCPAGATCTAVLDEDPLFVRAPDAGPDGTWGTEDDDYGDLRVQAGSPALDYGLTSLLPADTWDIDGDGDRTEVLPLDVAGGRRVWGPEVDVGAYERGPSRRAPNRARAAASVGAAPAVWVSVWPNPLRREGAVTVTLAAPGAVEVGLYDVLGRRVALLHEGTLSSGPHTFPLDGAALPAGVYVVRGVAGGGVVTRAVTLVR
jgi:hypothetical protein